MQNLFYEVDSLDKRCYEEFHLSEDILMEHAANGMARYIQKHYQKMKSILIVCGSGNNGADGITLARLLHLSFDIKLYLHKDPKSDIGKLQLKRVQAIGLHLTKDLEDADLIVDALFGSGLNKELSQEASTVLEQLNLFNGVKIACDMPSGLNKEGHLYKHAFIADVTLTMGALKRGLYSDKAKDIVGDIHQIDLGIHKDLYEKASKWKLLDTQDLKPPFRDKKNTHKGSFGHLSVLHGEKEGAAIISALSALSYGAGLVTLVGEKITGLPYSLMQNEVLPSNTTAIACGMGLGKTFQRDRLSKIFAHDIPCVLDADIFYHSISYDLFHRDIIITPHPKEFVHILRTTQLADISLAQLQNDRFKYTELFCKTFPSLVLVLKGANTIIGKNESFFINPHGSSRLAKGGSGDILSGLCGALLSQGYSPLDAAVQASLAQTLSAEASNKNSYAITPQDIIEGLSHL
ncbi:MAG: bifunctional ADP-dependent NAD(P)H-hydrate dehydratase/NAD(P)H-hydrate epimerase [Arcobacter sp.]|nr:MAG: bifunctional ADP-dependent NAD(P)H-hydrate dehydratase/NAD(P)H-hydrate epimerase [Arcobacter sp.]